jgi:hypothetical protein
MPKSSESINNSLFDLLRSKGYNPTMLDTAGKEIPVPDEAEVFQFDFIKDEVNYGTVTISIDGLQKLTIYYNDNVANSKKHDNDETTGSSWYSLLKQLKKFAKSRQLGFELKNSNHLKHDMAKRDFMKQKNKISEGYYPMGKKASYSDSVPNVKIVIEHTRQIEEGEQRYRNINRIFLENQLGERFLLDTKKPGIARVYARHVAEGGKVNDERWGHINNLCEEYQKMAGFVRATRNGQFNESAQKLVNEGINHYQSLRETLSRMTGHRGYNMYFESWTPALMEDETDTNAINELFVQETLDPRIESVMPILSKLHKQVAEMKEVSELSEWADSLLEGGDGGEASEEPIFTEPVDELPAGGNDAPEDNLDEGTEPTLDDVLARHSDAVEAFRQGGDMDYDLESDLWDYYFTSGDIKNYDADASEFLSQKLADHLGIDESLDESGLQFAKKVGGALKTAGKKVLDVISPDDDKQLIDLRNRAGLSNPEHGKPNMAKPNKESTEDQMDEGWKDKLAAVGLAGAMAMGASGANARVSYDADGNKVGGFKPVATQQAGGSSQELNIVDNISKDSDGSYTITHNNKEYQVKIVPKNMEAVPRSATKVKVTQAQMGVRGIGTYVAYLLPNGTAFLLSGQPTNEEGVAEGSEQVYKVVAVDKSNYFGGKEEMAVKADSIEDLFSRLSANDWYPLEINGVEVVAGKRLKQGVAEDLDANQKRVGQLGPTEKVKNNNIGKLVGANESVEQLGELKKSTVKSYADKKQAELDDVPPMPFKKPGMSKAEHEKAAKGMTGALARLSGKKPTSESVKEGQEDLDAMLRIVRK